MLMLKNVTKQYVMGENTVDALKGIDVEFKKSDFISIFGPSGCGKTTMLNIIGGLDRYTSGDMLVDGISTKGFTDRDWDTYRNRTIGFVFQNYNLIAHQNVLDNVAIALTLSGVGSQERKAKALAALEAVGIADQAYKRPNQLSGGQMQRVAIARALVNDPKIILADEPTGALDSVTSEQIMKILKDISATRLVIMVTHNAELAQQYSTRIIRLHDGLVTEDTDVSKVAHTKKHGEDIEFLERAKAKDAHTSMSYFTALKLSFKNLLTKKTRTILTAIAGSIGIIGVALVLALSSGMNAYIDRVQHDTLSSIPIQISQTTQINRVQNMSMPERSFPSEPIIMPVPTNYHFNDLSPQFLSYLGEIDSYTTAITYSYSTSFSVLYRQNNLAPVSRLGDSLATSISMSQLPGSNDFIATTFDVIGHCPDEIKPTESDAIPLTLMVDANNRISSAAAAMLGGDANRLLTLLTGVNPSDIEDTAFTFSDFLGKQFRLAYNDDILEEDSLGRYYYIGDQPTLVDIYENRSTVMYINDIIRVKESTPNMLFTPGLAYPYDLSQKVTDHQRTKDFVTKLSQKLEDITTNVESDPSFTDQAATDEEILKEYRTLVGRLVSAQRYNLPAQQEYTYIAKYFGMDTSPSDIQIFAKDFDAKEKIKTHLANWNLNADGTEKPLEQQIHYSDIAEMVTNVIQTLISTISIVLIVFAAISLVVSTVMIGIITYVSVVERTKEIGILRSIGARKKDISRVFNAETIIVGFTAGMIGVLVTFLLCIPISLIVASLTEVSGIAQLPILEAVVLVVISCVLTLIGGLIPSRIAAKRDPVVALRTE